MNLGQLIDALKKVQDKEKYVFIQPFNLVPTNFNSYRGYYDELALGFDLDGSMTVNELLDLAKNALNREFIGYKGGEFTMLESTPIWISNYSRVSDQSLWFVNEDSISVDLIVERNA